MSAKVGLGQVVMAGVVLVGVIWYMASDTGDQSAPVQTAAAASVANAPAPPAQPVDFSDSDHYTKNQAVPDATCRKSLACWSDKHLAMAEVECKDAVAAATRYEVKWTDGMFHPMFSRVKWSAVKGDDSIVYIGDELEVQNQFGAFEKMTYACPYAVDTGKVIAAELYPGKLPVN